MKILILTPINPVIAIDSYVKITKALEKEGKNTSFISIPFFAELEASMKEKEYLPTVFSMLKAAEEEKLMKKLLNPKGYDHTVFIGNAYKTMQFDMVVSLGYNADEELPFDAYIAALEADEEQQKFKELLRLNELYTAADCELHLPTIDHAILFIREVIKNGDTKRYKFKS